MGCQPSDTGSYRAPALPIQTAISEPVQIAFCPPDSWEPEPGAPAVDVTRQVSDDGSYRPPVPGLLAGRPPQMIISEPVHTALCSLRGAGTPVPIEVGAHVSVSGL